MHTAPQPSPTPASPARTEPPLHAARAEPQHFVGADAERLAEDTQREQAIAAAGLEAEHHMQLRQEALQRLNASGCMGDQGEADRQLLKARGAAGRMATLIRERSPGQVERMRAAQADRMAREPGATRA